MNSLSKISENKLMIDRINNLKDDSKANWGKMNVGQMLAHTQVGLKLATGEIVLKRNILGILFGGIGKKTINR